MNQYVHGHNIRFAFPEVFFFKFTETGNNNWLPLILPSHMFSNITVHSNTITIAFFFSISDAAQTNTSTQHHFHWKMNKLLFDVTNTTFCRQMICTRGDFMTWKARASLFWKVLLSKRTLSLFYAERGRSTAGPQTMLTLRANYLKILSCIKFPEIIIKTAIYERYFD